MKKHRIRKKKGIIGSFYECVDCNQSVHVAGVSDIDGKRWLKDFRWGTGCDKIIAVHAAQRLLGI